MWCCRGWVETPSQAGGHSRGKERISLSPQPRIRLLRVYKSFYTRILLRQDMMWCGKGLGVAASLARGHSTRQDKVKLSPQVNVGLFCAFSVIFSLLVYTFFLTYPRMLNASSPKMDAPPAVIHTAVSLPQRSSKRCLEASIIRESLGT